MLPTEVTEISILTSFTMAAGITKPLQLPIKTIRSKSVIHKGPSTSEKVAYQDNSFRATFHQFRFRKSTTLRFSKF